MFSFFFNFSSISSFSSNEYFENDFLTVEFTSDSLPGALLLGVKNSSIPFGRNRVRRREKKHIVA